jgi:OOP family OmpA-OmpF porin
MNSAKSLVFAIAAFTCAAFLAVGGAMLAVQSLERSTKAEIEIVLVADGIDWVEVATDGLLITLTGTGPSEADRFHVLTLANTVVDATRVIDQMNVVASAAIAAPDFLMEILRNNNDVSIIGLVPLRFGHQGVIDDITALTDDMIVADMLESADHPIPRGWVDAVAFSLDALEVLPVTKISVTPTRVEITAITNSPAERERVSAQLTEMVPNGLGVVLDISAPRPVITPFTLRFTLEDGAARFDACSTSTAEARRTIIQAAIRAGITGTPSCTIGLGAPSGRWSQAAVLSIDALAAIGTGSVTMSDTDISLVVPHTVDQALFDHTVGELEAAMPDIFSLESVVLAAPDTRAVSPQDAIEFIATLSPEGLVQLRGRLTDERIRDAVTAYARARFGVASVHMAARLDDELPDGWPLRALVALEALAQLNNGLAIVRPARIEVRGVSGNPDASDVVSRLLSEALEQGSNFRVDITYEERLDPVANAPTPERCVANIATILSTQQITFAPGSTSIDGTASATLDRIADVLRECGELGLEVSGHTDSQGRAETNMTLSQGRAEAVIDALLARRILVSSLVPRGYGQDRPIGENDTADGREANRRIEFTLIAPEDPNALREGQIARDDEAEAALQITVTDATDQIIHPRTRPTTN